MNRARLRYVCRATLCAAAILAGCKDSLTGLNPSATTVEQQLFTDMNQNNFSQAPALVGTFHDLQDQQPTNFRNTFLLGASSFWWIAEAGRPGTNQLQVLSATLPLILESFSDVIQNDPADATAAMVFLGAFLHDTGLDTLNGTRLIDSAAVLSPQTSFQQLFVRRFAPANDPATAAGIEAGFKFWEHCTGVAISRTNPDFTNLVRPPQPESFCWGSNRVPHGFEGAWLIMGDMLVKGGQLDVAKRAYQNAQLGANYKTWLFKDSLEARLASDLTQRHNTYLNPDPTRWASIGIVPFSCVQCHGSAP